MTTSEEDYEKGWRQGVADAALLIRVQGEGKITPHNRDAFFSASNSIIDLRDETREETRPFIDRLRRQYGDPDRLMLVAGGRWIKDVGATTEGSSH